MLVYVGTFTSADRNGRGEGIYVFEMDRRSGELRRVQVLPDVEDPSFLALHPTRPLLFCNNASLSEGAISSFAIDPDTGRIGFLDRRSSHGASPAHVSVHPDGRWVFAANYGSGSVCMLPLRDDGRLGEATDVVHHEGPGGPVTRRQESAHAHQIVPTVDGRFVLANDLGLDRTYVYRPDLERGKLLPNDPPFAPAHPGAGPRHLAFHPRGPWVYVINEIAPSVTAFAWDAVRGAMTPLQTIPTLPAPQAGSSTAQVVVHPNGRFLYGSNRGHDSIAIFAVDQDSGRLTAIGHAPSGGKTPRNFGLDPSARFLYAAHQDSDTVVQHRLLDDGARLEPTGHVVEVGSPVCVLFRPTD
jgi:6-phosphogluconolactonase